MNWIPGLVSVTFRAMTPEQVAQAARDSGLQGIEWGGDIHAPDEAGASRAREITQAAGLQTTSYGSYFRLGEGAEAFDAVSQNAQALGTDMIRIWAGRRNHEDVPQAEYRALVREAQALAEAAAQRGQQICFEYHNNTLTNTAQAARALVEDIARENVALYWQPNQFQDWRRNLVDLCHVMPYVRHVHVFAWEGDTRLPLAQGREAWAAYLDAFAQEGSDRVFLLEFVKDDNPAQLRQDAAELLRWMD